MNKLYKTVNKEKRAANRAKVSWEIRGNSDKLLFTGVISNVSSIGCLASISRTVKEDDLLTVFINIKTKKGLKIINATAIVKRTIVKNNQCFAGIQFKDISSVDKKIIEGYVNEFLRKQIALA